jgi:hypothetical protein
VCAESGGFTREIASVWYILAILGGTFNIYDEQVRED